jgi:hypothetical protein
MTNTVRLSIGMVALLGLTLGPSRPAQATQISLELRHTLVQTKMTPEVLVALTGTAALAVTEHFWVGGGYELIQNHEGILWKTDKRGETPITLSAIRAGFWYRNGEGPPGLTYAVGPLVTYANRAFAFSPSPQGLDNDTYFVDFGADMSFGYLGRRARIEAFITPAWSLGRVVSPAVDKEEHHSAFVVRMGLAFALMFGS